MIRIRLKEIRENNDMSQRSLREVLKVGKSTYSRWEKGQLDKNKIGQNLKSIRKELNYTQEELAKLFNTTHSTISAYENGKTIILTAFAIELCKRYGYSLDWICNKR